MPAKLALVLTLAAAGAAAGAVLPAAGDVVPLEPLPLETLPRELPAEVDSGPPAAPGPTEPLLLDAVLVGPRSVALPGALARAPGTEQWRALASLPVGSPPFAAELYVAGAAPAGPVRVICHLAEDGL